MTGKHNTRSDNIHITLASSSPRRRQLLEQIGVNYQSVIVDIDESIISGESPQNYVARLALEKARAGRRQGDDGYPVLGADTAVVLDDEIMGKPADRTQGLEMLEKLSGRSHRVMSGVALIGDTEQVRVSTSTVWFRPTSQHEREAYWASGEPADKAGGYAVQGHAAVFISRIDGSFSGIMGLPLFETCELLAAAGIQIL